MVQPSGLDWTLLKTLELTISESCWFCVLLRLFINYEKVVV